MTKQRITLSIGLVSAIAASSTALAQEGPGLGGPSSVQADLQRGDGRTDSQFRFDFPRNIAPGYFRWKDGLAEGGIKFNFDYLSLGQWSNSDLGTNSSPICSNSVRTFSLGKPQRCS